MQTSREGHKQAVKQERTSKRTCEQARIQEMEQKIKQTWVAMKMERTRHLRVYYFFFFANVAQYKFIITSMS